MSRPTVAASGRRGLHPGAWWLWAACLAGAASRTTNPILLLLIGAVVVFVVAARRTDAPWSRSIVVFLRLGLVVIVIRVALEIVFGDRLPGHVLFTLPQVPLPSWAAGVSIGGPVTAEAVIEAAVEGLRLAVVLICFGAANSLASPYRLLRCLPAVLYEAGVAITVSLSFAPELVMAIADVRAARRLRGRPARGLAGLRGMAMPVLERALDRSLQLASSMDARGYGAGCRCARGVPGAGHGGSTAGGLLLLVAGALRRARCAGSLPGGGLPFVAVGSVARRRRAGGQRSADQSHPLPPGSVAAAGVAGVGARGSWCVGHDRGRRRCSGVPGLQFAVVPARPSRPCRCCRAVGILVGLAAGAGPLRWSGTSPAARPVAPRPAPADEPGAGAVDPVPRPAAARRGSVA